MTNNDSRLGNHSGNVAWFGESVSPITHFEEGEENGFAELYTTLRTGRKILSTTPISIAQTKFRAVNLKEMSSRSVMTSLVTTFRTAINSPFGISA